MGSVNLDNTGSGSAITLSSDGTSLLLNGTAIGGGGGADLYAANDVNATAPSATGDNSVAIGPSSEANSADATAFGYRSEAKASKAVAIGEGRAGGASATAISIGTTSTAYGATGVRSIAMGYQAKATGTYSTALGQNSVATGQDSFAIGKSLASSTNSFAAAIATNSSSYGASGSNSIAGGDYNKATATDSLCWGGDSNVAQSGAKSAVVGGWQNNCSGAYSFIGGGRGNKITSGSYSRAGGLQADVNGTGIDTWSSGRFSSDGDAQTSKRVLIASTTDATATVLGTQNINSLAANQVTLPNNSAFAFHGTIVARQQAADGTACAAWKVEGLIRREGSAGTTVLVNSATTVLDNTPNWGMALSANTSLGCLKIEVTGAASTDIRWVATIHTSEVTYA
jgi:hypothetical protein